MGQDDGDQAVAYLEWGFAEFGEGKASLEYTESMIDTYRSLARKCEEAGDIEMAETYYDRILELDSDDDDAAKRKAALGSRREFEKYYDDILDMVPD